MNVVTFAFPLVYTALYTFAVLFLLKTKNEKFYQKISFAVFVVSAATWGWGELLQNAEGLRSMAYWFTKISFASALLGVEVLFLICLELLNLRFSFKQFWYFYFLLLFLPVYSFIPGFIVQGFTEVNNHLAITAGYADFFYTNLIILTSSITLFLYLLVFKISDQTTRKRISPIILAFVLTLISGVFFNIFLPISFNNEAFTSFAPLSMGTVVVALAYSVIKWNLLGITFNEKVSYSQINQMWKSNDKKIHDQIREAFNQVVELVEGQQVEVKKIVFLGGTVDWNGNVHLYYQKFVKLLFVYYASLRLVFSKRIFQMGKEGQKIIIILNKPSQDLTSEKIQARIVDSFFSLSHYKRAAEGVIINYLKTTEKNRLV